VSAGIVAAVVLSSSEGRNGNDIEEDTNTDTTAGNGDTMGDGDMTADFWWNEKEHYNDKCKSNGDTWDCSCYTDQNTYKGNYVAYNGCPTAGTSLGNGDVVDTSSDKNIAVYSPESTTGCLNIFGNQCKCTCFNSASITSGGYPHNIDSCNPGDGVKPQGSPDAYETCCVGMCGADCSAREVTDREEFYAALVIHDLCQAYIGSRDPISSVGGISNNCADEAVWGSLTSGILWDTIVNGRCGD